MSALRNIGGLLRMDGKVRESIPVLEKAAELDPTSTKVYLNLGKAYFDIGDYEKAIAQWQRVLKLDPNNGMAYSNIRVAERLMGQQ